MSNRIPNIHLASTPAKSTIITFQIIHFIFSLNFGFIQKRWLKNLSLTVYFANAITLTCYAWYSLNDLNFLQFWFSFGMYLTYFSTCILILFFNNKLSFYEYLCRLQKIDSKLLSGKERFSDFGARLILIFLINVLLRVATNFSYCSQFSNQCFPSFFVSVYYLEIFILTFDIAAFVNCLIFNLAYYRLKKFVDLVKEMKKTAQRININHFILYKEIIDLTEEIKTAFDPLFMINFLFTFPSIVVIAYITVAAIKWDNVPIVSMFVFIQISSVTQSTILVLTPTIFGGMLSYKAKELKVELRSLVLFERDQIHMDNIERLIKYVEARDFNFQVYGVIPLQPHLFMTVLNICIGYLIIIIQLTHLD